MATGYGGGVGCADKSCKLFLNDSSGMPQHFAYYPAMHGYYYFHPYHHTHVVYEQQFASQFGMDPRNPHANDVFKMVYAEYKASQDAGVEQVPTSPPVAVPKRKVRTF
jgi:hypothetical protein